MAPRPFDAVVYGASGFTGRLVASYLAKSGANVAIAGRSEQALKQTNLHGLPVLVADANHPRALRDVARASRVIVNTAGPYTTTGTNVVRACIQEGTNYVDINGEVPWTAQIISEFDEAAIQSNVRVVPNCGFSAPSDLGVFFALSHLPPCIAPVVKGVIHFHGQLSGGTVSTGIMLDEMPDSVQRIRNDPFALCALRPQLQTHFDDDPTSAMYDTSLRQWCTPFWMSAISSRVVRRSAELFAQAADYHNTLDGTRNAYDDTSESFSQLSIGRVLKSGGYGNKFSYREMAAAPNEDIAQTISRSPPPSVDRRKRLLSRGKLRRPGEGPSVEVRGQSWFRSYFQASNEKGECVLVTVSGGDPGYDETSKIVGEACLLLCEKPELVPLLPRSSLGGGGVVTPAFAFGPALIRALHARGLCFEVVDEARYAELEEQGHRVVAPSK